MKTKFLSLLGVAVLVAGTSSCNKNVELAGDAGENSEIRITLTFASSSTKAITSDDKVPTTTWDDIQSLALFFASSESSTSGLIRYANDVYDMLEGSGDTRTVTVSNIPSGDYTLYVLANYKTSDTQAQTYGYGGVPATSITAGTWVNRNISDLYLDIAQVSPIDYYLEVDPGTHFTAAPNYFVGSSSVSVVADNTATGSVTITRLASLARVRVNNTGNADNQNYKIDFTDDDASLMLRRINNRYSVGNASYDWSSYSFTTAGSYSTSLYFDKGYQTSEPQNGYRGTENIVTSDYGEYKDVLVFPTIGSTSAEMYNVVVTGVALEDYEAQNGTASAGDLVAWAGNISLTNVTSDGNLPANYVMVVNVNLTTIGRKVTEDDPLPDADTYGSLDLTVSLEDWADLVTVDLDL